MIFLNLGALVVREFECLENLQTITNKNYRDLLSDKISDLLLGDQTEIRIDILFASLSQIWLRYPDLLPIQDESPVFDKLQDYLTKGKLGDAIAVNIFDSFLTLVSHTDETVLAKLNFKVQKLFALLPSPAGYRYKLFQLYLSMFNKGQINPQIDGVKVIVGALGDFDTRIINQAYKALERLVLTRLNLVCKYCQSHDMVDEMFKW